MVFVSLNTYYKTKRALGSQMIGLRLMMILMILMILMSKVKKVTSVLESFSIHYPQIDQIHSSSQRSPSIKISVPKQPL